MTIDSRKMQGGKLQRRTLLKLAGTTFASTAATAAAGTVFGASLPAATDSLKLIRHTIPSSGEQLPAIGFGTAGNLKNMDDPASKKALGAVLQTFFAKGGTLVDSSPMYGNAESAIGELLDGIKDSQRMFAATKVWIDGRDAGIAQMEQSFQRMGVGKMDLMQIHNLRDWKIHLATLRDWKEQGKIRYIGITTSHGRDHAELERIMKQEPLDFVQLSYSLGERVTEERLLPLAADKGIATLVNRPFQRGELFSAVRGKDLPPWAVEFDCESWGQFFLKFAISHPAATCAIPSTSKTKHMHDNMQAAYGRLPNTAMRKKMISLLQSY